jgi:hypothetical protein
MANKEDELFDENSKFLKGPFKYLQIEFERAPTLITLVKDHFDDLEFEVITSNRRREPIRPEFTYAVCESIARPYLRRKSAREKALVRVCRKAMRTIRAYETCGDVRAWYEKLVGEIKIVFFAYALLNEFRNVHGIGASTARKVLARLKRKKRQQAKRSP